MEFFFGYLYIGNVIFDEENVESFVVVVDYLFIQSFKDIGCEFLEGLFFLLKCFILRDFVEKYSCDFLKSFVMCYIVKYFNDVCNIEVFKLVEYRVYIEIIVCDDFEVLCEEDVYEMLIKWVKYDLEIWKEYFDELFSKICLFLLLRYYLIN